jgi:predicted RNase H-like HicB family nuclease
MTEGDTEKEVLVMLDDAKKAWLQVALERKQTIPEPTTEE